MRKIAIMLINLSLALWSTVSYGAFVSGSTGADGPFNPTANTIVTLPVSGKLNYTTVNIPEGVTVTFQKNAANTPVYMLASENVTINGTISLDGSNGSALPGDGGPGGFKGGYGGTMSDSGGKGLGPGGGLPGSFGNNYGGGGGFGTSGYNWVGNGGSTYGNAALLPLIGGSGGAGAGGPSNPPRSGAGGGGAILIASSGYISINGLISANGGIGQNGGGGSGGGVRIIANNIYGIGSITAMGGNNGRGDHAGCGGAGRIRFESYSNNNSIITNPSYSYGSPKNVFATNIPTLTITSIGGETTPEYPTANYNQPDITLPSNVNPVTVNISAFNIPTDTAIVKVRVIPQYGTDSYFTVTLTGNQQASTGSVDNITLSTAYSSVITAEATFTVVAMYHDGEQIDKVHVAATMGGKSETTYITKSGKTIKGDLVAFAK